MGRHTHVVRTDADVAVTIHPEDRFPVPKSYLPLLPHLTGEAVKVLVVCCAAASWSTWRFRWLSKTLADSAGLHPSAVRRALAQLRKRGVLHSKRTGGACWYQLLPVTGADVARARAGATSRARAGATSERAPALHRSARRRALDHDDDDHLVSITDDDASKLARLTLLVGDPESFLDVPITTIEAVEEAMRENPRLSSGFAANALRGKIRVRPSTSTRARLKAEADKRRRQMEVNRETSKRLEAQAKPRITLTAQERAELKALAKVGEL